MEVLAQLFPNLALGFQTAVSLQNLLYCFAGVFVGTLLIALFGPSIAEMALKFGAPEYFSLMVMGLMASAMLAHGALLKALGMIVLGLLFGIVGTDVNSGMSRFAFGVAGLTDGISFVVIAMGLFGFAEIVANLERGGFKRDLLFQKIKNMWPTWDDFRRAWAPVLRGTGIGAFFGTLPGAGPTIAAFSTYPARR